jgi:hypothetical protein
LAPIGSVEINFDELAEECGLPRRGSVQNIYYWLEEQDLVFRKRMRRGVWTGVRLQVNPDKAIEEIDSFSRGSKNEWTNVRTNTSERPPL